MAKIKVTLKLDPNVTPKIMFSPVLQDRLGSMIVAKMKELIAAGISPVKGEGRFEAYSAQRKANAVATVNRKSAGGFKRAQQVRRSSSLYPNSVRKQFPGKQLRPVNLNLSGQLINALNYFSRTGQVEVGHVNASDRTRRLFDVHNEGKDENVPQRKYLPNKPGEEFVATIMTMIKSIYRDRIKSQLKKK